MKEAALPPGLRQGIKEMAVPVGVGIAGMRERLRQVGGQLEIESNDRGTTVRAIVTAATQRVVRQLSSPMRSPSPVPVRQKVENCFQRLEQRLAQGSTPWAGSANRLRAVVAAAPAPARSRSRSQPEFRYLHTPDSHSGALPGFSKAHAWSGFLQCTHCLQDGLISQMAPDDTTVGRTPGRRARAALSHPDPKAD